MFLMAGAMKATQPREKLLKQRPWTENFSTGRVRFIGVVELLAAIGLIVPAASGIAVVFLTPLAAAGLVVMTLLAVPTHIRRREPAAVAFTTVLLLATAVVA
jgi:DoxX-like family